MTAPAFGYPSRDALLDDLVVANRILFTQGVVDALGHVSARDPDHAGRFIIARNMAPSLVTRADLILTDLEANAVDGDARKPYSERWIHAAIYAARPDVHGIVHSHSHAVIPFGITPVDLRPVSHTGSFLGLGVARFDTQDTAGDTDLLVRNMPLARALAAALGDRAVALMRGHGSVAVGRSMREAVARAIYTEVNAKLQAEALRMGPVTYVTAGETSIRDRREDDGYRRMWEFWKAEAGLA